MRWSIEHISTHFACGLSYTDRKIICWGEQSCSNVPLSVRSISYSSVNSEGEHVCALRADGSGTVDCWGDNQYGQCTPPKATSFTYITAGYFYTCGLVKSSSSAVCWGRSITFVNQCIPDPGKQYSVISAGLQHICGIEKVTRKTLCWGGNEFKQCEPPSQYNFSALTAGGAHTCGIREDTHEAVCWGDNTYGQLNVGAGIKFSAISAGDTFTCGVRLDEPMLSYCWGWEEFGQNYIRNISIAPCQSKCDANQYEMNSSSLGIIPCPNSDDKVCVDCSRCSNGSVEASPCGANKDRTCAAAASSNSPPPPQKSSPSETKKTEKKKTFPLLAVAVAISVSIPAIISLVCLYWKVCLARKAIQSSSPWEDTPVQRIEEFSNVELSTATRSYSSTMYLGKGTFGVVYKGVLSDKHGVTLLKV